MEHVHELWFTALLNQYLAGPANQLIELVGMHAHDPLKPWTNYNAMLVLGTLLILLLPWLVRGGMSVEKPSKLAQTFEVVFEYLKAQSKEVAGHDGPKYIFYFLSVFTIILIYNLLGVVPTLESPTMSTAVPLGLAMMTFIYYNAMGVQAQGVIGHLKHFAGPILWLGPIMFVLELISHSIRPVSLTIRLYANMVASEQISIAFIELVPWVIPAIFFGLHVIVSILQAYIFTTLTMAYVGGVVAHEEAH